MGFAVTSAAVSFNTKFTLNTHSKKKIPDGKIKINNCID